MHCTQFAEAYLCAQRTGIPQLHRYDVASPTRIDTSLSAGEWYSPHPSIFFFFSLFPSAFVVFCPALFPLLAVALPPPSRDISRQSCLKGRKGETSKPPGHPHVGGRAGLAPELRCATVKFNIIQGRGIESEAIKASRHPEPDPSPGTDPATDGNWRVPNGQTSFRAIHFHFISSSLVPQALTQNKVSILPCIFSLVAGYPTGTHIYFSLPQLSDLHAPIPLRMSYIPDNCHCHCYKYPGTYPTFTLPTYLLRRYR